MLKIYVFIRMVANWFDYHIGLHFSLSSKGQAAAVSTDPLNARVRYLPQSYFGKYSSVPFFKSVSMARSFFFFFFLLSRLYLTLKSVKDRCSSPPVLEDFHWSDCFPSLWLLGWLLPSSWGCIFTGSADPATALGVIDCCFSNNKAYSLDFYYS